MRAAIVLPTSSESIKNAILEPKGVTYSHPWLIISKGFEELGWEVIVPLEESKGVESVGNIFVVPPEKLSEFAPIDVGFFFMGPMRFRENLLGNLKRFGKYVDLKVFVLESLGTEIEDSMRDVIDKFSFAYPAYKFLSPILGSTYYLYKRFRAEKYRKIYENLFRRFDVIWLNTYYGAYTSFYKLLIKSNVRFFVHPFPVSPVFLGDIDVSLKENVVVAVATRWSRAPKNWRGLNEIIRMYDNYCKERELLEI